MSLRRRIAKLEAEAEEHRRDGLLVLPDGTQLHHAPGELLDVLLVVLDGKDHEWLPVLRAQETASQPDSFPALIQALEGPPEQEEGEGV